MPPRFMKPRTWKKAQWSPVGPTGAGVAAGEEMTPSRTDALIAALSETNDRVSQLVYESGKAADQTAAGLAKLTEALNAYLESSKTGAGARPGIPPVAGGAAEAVLRGILYQLQVMEGVLLEDMYHRMGWVVRTWERPQTVSAGKTVPILQALREDGFVSYMRIEMDSPQPYVQLESAGQLWRSNIDTLFTLGQVQANPSSWWVSEYNVTDGYYTLQWTPSPLWPYSTSVEVFINNETAVDLVVESAEIVRYTTRGPPE